MADPPEPPVDCDPGQLTEDSTAADSGTMTGSLLQNLIFLNWVQFPPLPRVPDLSDPAKFREAFN